MSATSPEALKLAWQWVIEALMDINKVETSLLTELIRRNPEVLKDSSVNEKVSLRYLEELVDSDDLKPGEVSPSMVDSGVLENCSGKITVDSRSEDVLCRFLQQVDRLPTKEHPDGAMHKHEVRTFISQKRAVLPKSYLLLLEDSIDKTCVKSVSSLMGSHGLPKEIQPNHLHNLNDDESEGVDRLKKISSCSDKVPSSPLLDRGDAPSPNMSPGAGVHSAVLHGLNQCKKGSVCIANDSTLSHGSKGKQSPGELQDRDKKHTHRSLSQTIPSDHEGSEESIKDQDEHDGAFNETLAAFVKTKLVSSQIPNDDTQQEMCIKCSKGDQLLLCSGDRCPIAIHESCLCCPVSFDEDTGEFHCPLCSYIEAANAYSNAKKKVFRCMDSLSSFMVGFDQVSRMKAVQSVSQKRSSSPDEGVGERYGIQERVKRNKGNAMKETEEHNITGEYVMNSSKTLNRKGKEAVIIFGDNNASTSNGIAKSSDKDNHDIRLTKESERNKGNQGSHASEQHLFGESVKRMNGDSSSPCHKNNASEKGNVYYSDLDDFEELEDQMPSSSAEDREVQIPAQENHSEKYRKPPKRLKRYANSLYPYTRRNRLAWTYEEEMILKAGVEKFSDGKVNYPWVQILEFGQHIFHKTRQPMDLKDKWRNMRKKM